jgi:hypothetical protein
MTQRYRTLNELLSQPRPAPAQRDELFEELCTRIREGKVVPILSNNLYNELIFAQLIERLNSAVAGDGAAAPAADGPALTVNETLANAWADDIGYPMGDRMVLARVAQFNRINSRDEEQAKRRFLKFVKDSIVQVVGGLEPERLANIPQLDAQLKDWSVGTLTSELGLLTPDRPESPPNALRMLARLNLPIYATTSYYDFLEQAIRSEGRPDVRSEMPDGDPEDGEQRPTAQSPVVFHLHGSEAAPKSIVLSEDDYLAFLMRVTQPMDEQRPFLPPYLREQLAECTLLLLGYRLQDWDFLTLFHGLIKAKEAPRRPFSVAIQLSPRQQRSDPAPEQAEQYLKSYFEAAKIQVLWRDSHDFVRELWGKWNTYRGGGQP